MITCPFNSGYHQENHNLIVCHPKGALTADLMNDFAYCREYIHMAGLPQMNRFHDLMNITSIDLNFKEAMKIIQFDLLLKESESIPQINACYLVPNPILYGAVQMYQSLIEKSGVQVHVSYEINKLADILGVDKSVLTTVW